MTAIMPMMKPENAKINPLSEAILSGLIEKEVTPLSHKETDFLKL